MPSHTLLITLAGAGIPALAQPVARHLIDDADSIEKLYMERSQASATFRASMHLLDDLDNDGVREFLLTHTAEEVDGDPVADYFHAEVRSPGTGKSLLVLPRDHAKGTKLAHTAALLIDDINGDGVRDLAAARELAGGIGLRVYCGATGELLRAPFAENFRFSWGLSLMPWEDLDGDGQPDLIATNLGDGVSSYLFISWSPGTGAAEFFRPEGYPIHNAFFQGRTLLDLGVGATGAREFLGTIGAFGGAAVHLFGGEPVGFRGSLQTQRPQSPGHEAFVSDGGAVRLGDLNGDGYREIVVTGRLSLPHAPDEFGIPILSGALQEPWPRGILEPLTLHMPRIVVDVDGEPTTIEPLANNTLIPLGDATGDGSPTTRSSVRRSAVRAPTIITVSTSSRCAGAPAARSSRSSTKPPAMTLDRSGSSGSFRPHRTAGSATPWSLPATSTATAPPTCSRSFTGWTPATARSTGSTSSSSSPTTSPRCAWAMWTSTAS